MSSEHPSLSAILMITGSRFDTDPWWLRDVRRSLAAGGRYDVGRLTDAQAMAMASRDATDAMLLERWARRLRTGFAVGSATQGVSPAAPDFREEEESPRPAAAPPATPTPAPATLAWIELEVVDEDGLAYANEIYQLCATGGRNGNGQLDEHGHLRLDDIPGGTCRFDFPELVSAALDEA